MLPRFTSGQLGRLTFEHLNEICDTVDRLRPLLITPNAATLNTPDLVFARITNTVGTYGDHRWVEVWPKTKADYNRYVEWEDRPDGRQSFASTDGDRYQPAYAVPAWSVATGAGVSLNVNSIVSMLRLVGADGKKIARLDIGGGVEAEEVGARDEQQLDDAIADGGVSQELAEHRDAGGLVERLGDGEEFVGAGSALQLADELGDEPLAMDKWFAMQASMHRGPDGERQADADGPAGERQHLVRPGRAGGRPLRTRPRAPCGQLPRTRGRTLLHDHERLRRGAQPEPGGCFRVAHERALPEDREGREEAGYQRATSK